MWPENLQRVGTEKIRHRQWQLVRHMEKPITSFRRKTELWVYYLNAGDKVQCHCLGNRMLSFWNPIASQHPLLSPSALIGSLLARHGFSEVEIWHLGKEGPFKAEVNIRQVVLTGNRMPKGSAY